MSSGTFNKISGDLKGMSEEQQKKLASENLKNVDMEMVEMARNDLKELLGREPTPAEVSKFLMDMPNSPIYTPQRQQQAKKDQANGVKQVSPSVVEKAKRDLKTLLGREPTAKEVEKFLTDLKGGQSLTSPQTSNNKPGDDFEPVDQDIVNKGVDTLKAKLGRTPTAKELEDHLMSQAKGNKAPKDPVLRDILSDTPASSGTKQESWSQVDQSVVNSIQADLKSILGREPTAKEVEEFLQDMADTQGQNKSKELTADTIDKATIQEAKGDLKELLGREPTEQELNDFLKDITDEEIDAEQFKQPAIGNPFLNHWRNTHEAIPSQPYTAEQAIARLKALGYANPTDQQINDWLYEFNEPLVGEQGFDEVDLPGITSVYTSPQYDYFSSTNVFILLLVMLIGGFIYKKKKKDTEDEYVKVDEDKGYLERLYNPFNRKNDKDDDFDKVL